MKNLTLLKYCAANKLSINFKKTNYMIITTPRKKTNIKITTCNIEQKSQIKYLGVYIDEHLQWDAQLKHVNNKITKNMGILYKLRYFVSINTLKQLYYTLIYPYYFGLGRVLKCSSFLFFFFGSTSGLTVAD